MKAAGTKPYILAAGIGVAAFVGLLVVVAFMANRIHRQEQDEFMAGVHQRLSAEKARWNNMTPEQRAAETAERKRADDARRAVAEASRHAAFIEAAKGACRIAIKDALNDPYSAKFDPSDAWTIREEPDGVLLVRPRLRAKNGFGAYAYSAMDCRVREEGENIRVIGIKQI